MTHNIPDDVCHHCGDREALLDALRAEEKRRTKRQSLTAIGHRIIALLSVGGILVVEVNIYHSDGTLFDGNVFLLQQSDLNGTESWQQFMGFILYLDELSTEYDIEFKIDNYHQNQTKLAPNNFKLFPGTMFKHQDRAGENN